MQTSNSSNLTERWANINMHPLSNKYKLRLGHCAHNDLNNILPYYWLLIMGPRTGYQLAQIAE